MHAPSYFKKTFFDKSSPAPCFINSGADKSWFSCGLFLAEEMEEEVVGTADRLSQVDRLLQVGTQDMEDTQE